MRAPRASRPAKKLRRPYWPRARTTAPPAPANSHHTTTYSCLGAGVPTSFDQVLADLEKRGALNRKLEAMPSVAEFKALEKSGEGLTSPELATLLAFTASAQADHPGEVKLDLANVFGSPEEPVEVSPAPTYRAEEPPLLPTPQGKCGPGSRPGDVRAARGRLLGGDRRRPADRLRRTQTRPVATGTAASSARASASSRRSRPAGTTTPTSCSRPVSGSRRCPSRSTWCAPCHLRTCR